jgi:hypothetical protein
MARWIGAVIVLVAFAAAAPARAQEESKAALVKRKAQEVGESLKKKDYAKVIDRTYPKAIELLGGREKAIRAVESEMKKAEDIGVSVASVTVGEPGEFLVEGKNTFVIVPTTTEMATPRGKLVARSYLLSISPDGGKTWTFIDGSGLQTPERRKLILPKLPEKLKLPEYRKPEFVKNK